MQFRCIWVKNRNEMAIVKTGSFAENQRDTSATVSTDWPRPAILRRTPMHHCDFRECQTA